MTTPPTLQEQAARMTLGALEMLFSAARHLPEDRLDWSPGEGARSARSQLLECAAAPLLHVPLIQGDPNPYAGAPYAAYRDAVAALAPLSLDDLLSEARRRHEPLVAALRALSDTDLTTPRPVPFGEGATMTGADLLFLPHWNLVYHTGQINYLQTLLGDTQMRFG